jgi:four helix bundle protein
MTTALNQPGASKFIALELSIQIVASLRDVVRRVRRHDLELARQIFRSASSISANLAEGGGREGRDRAHFFRIAAGSARETQVHLRVALAWESCSHAVSVTRSRCSIVSSPSCGGSRTNASSASSGKAAGFEGVSRSMRP